VIGTAAQAAGLPVRKRPCGSGVPE
jgi:hypothetical protein